MLAAVRFVIFNLVKNILGFRFDIKTIAFPHKTENPAESPCRQIVTSIIAKEFQDTKFHNRSVLELGCGSGYFLTKINLDQTTQYHGYDLRACLQSCENKKIYQTNLEKVSTFPALYDLIISVTFLEHVRNPARVLRIAHRSLKPAGKHFHIVPNGASLFLYGPHGWRQFNGKELKRISEEFSDSSIRYYHAGGLGTFLAHLLVITIAEQTLKYPFRQKLPRVYQKILDFASFCNFFVSLGAPVAVIQIDKN